MTSLGENITRPSHSHILRARTEGVINSACREGCKVCIDVYKVVATSQVQINVENPVQEVSIDPISIQECPSNLDIEVAMRERRVLLLAKFIYRRDHLGADCWEAICCKIIKAEF